MTELRYRELERIRDLVFTEECLMYYIAGEPDDPHACVCGKCANCAGPAFPREVMAKNVRKAAAFLRGDYQVIEPRRQ